MSETHPGRIHVERGFLPPAALARVLAAVERLGASWASSEALGLLGRGGAQQVRASDLAAQAPLDEIRAVLAAPVLRQARALGFWFARPPRLQLFPVRMLGDPADPPHQEPHTDSLGADPAPPICTSVYYVRAAGLVGGALAAEPPGAATVRLDPAANTLVTFPGERVHWVEPLTAGERVSVVVNFY